ncbi:MAG: hypothetical protein AB7Q97_23830 [Gammaproteobacteria bacterium]
MYLRLRQICLVARELEPVARTLAEVLGLSVCIRDPNVGKHGLENVVMPLDGTFLEVVSPFRPDTTAGRYLDRIGGDGGYMVILDCDDLGEREAHLARVGVRVPYTAHYPQAGYRALHLHPKDVGASLLSIDHDAHGADLHGAWHPGGEGWHAHVRTARVGAIRGVVLQSGNPAGLASRWGEILGRPAVHRPDHWAIALDNAGIEFIQAGDDRGETMQGIVLECRDSAAIEKAAAAAGCAAPGGALRIGGIQFHLDGARR